ncbi:MAG: hypothetical protein RLW62_05260, partial [Gammaproteobacteria bacterium]
FADGLLAPAATWLAGQAPNPFSCGTIGALLSLAVTVGVSLVTAPPSPAHLARVFGDAAGAGATALGTAPAARP